MTKAYQERLIALVKDTISLLCKNGLEYNQEFCVEGLLGVTLDKDEVFLIPIKELVADKGVSTTDVTDEATLDTAHDFEDGRRSPKRERKKKRRHAEATVTQDDGGLVYEEGSPLYESDHKARLTDQENEGYDTHEQPAIKRTHREERRAELCNVKAEDIVVIKEEVDDEEFASAFQDSSLDSSSLNRTDQGDSSMAFFPPPGTSQSGMSFSMDQLTGGAGLSGAIEGMPPGSEGDAAWLQQSTGDMQNQQGDWQGQKHQMPEFEAHRESHMENGSCRYSCPYCRKRFNSTGNLQGHIAVHTGRREFQCAECGKEFAYKSNLKAHRKKYHGESDIFL